MISSPLDSETNSEINAPLEYDFEVLFGVQSILPSIKSLTANNWTSTSLHEV